MKRMLLAKSLLACTCLLLSSSIMSQVVEVKKYNHYVGKARLKGSHIELLKGQYPATVFDVEILSGGAYYLKTIASFESDRDIHVFVDGQSVGQLTATGKGFQLGMGSFLNGKQVSLTRGMHQISFVSKTQMAPIISEISLSDNEVQPDIEGRWAIANRNLQAAAYQTPPTPANKNSANGARLLPNPSGSYNHDIEESFSYTTVQWIYLTAGTTEVFATGGSTADPVLMLFDPNSIDTRSWANDDFSGMESYLQVSIPATAWYILVARTYGTATGVTNLYRNGIVTHSATPIGGRRINIGTTNATTLNYFTSHLTPASGSTPDTRIFAMNSNASPAVGYNDDYATSGDWNWGLASRIKKTFSVTPATAFVSAYGLTTNGTCDIYAGAANSTVWSAFANLKADDAIRSGDATGTYYNCISWSGGVTAVWSWPLSNTSVYYNANPTTAFDNFYGNTPVKRYSGAWNYSRSGATVTNAVVDLWAYNGTYTHGSVKKPGNNNPHGYDWESKPGGLDRTFHPRNALNGAAPAYYGSVVAYYIHTGSYAPRLSGTGGMATDMDAIKAGMDVADKAALSPAAQEKLNAMEQRVAAGISQTFDKLYSAWQATWQENAVQSNPLRYCENEQYKTLLAYCQANRSTVLPLFFKQYLQGSAICDLLLCDLTLEKYGHLLEEVKKEYLANPYDKQGRYIINNQYCNGIRYIEKILAQMQPVSDNLVAGPVDGFEVKLSPNPVKDQLQVQLQLKDKATVAVQVINTQTGAALMLQKEAVLLAGSHRINGHIASLRAVPGTLLTVQVTVNGITSAYKLQVGS
jgi:hypothetical protein